MLCNYEVKGYCLRDRRWRKFSVDRISDVDWNEEPFDSLVLPDGYKDLILAFVESQLKQNERFDDVINGKGGGLVILLAGEPGVGKTLTAESVAEKIKAPLYKMELCDEEDDSDTSSRSSLSSYNSSRNGNEAQASTIEEQFEHATNWDAVMLLDECDAYLSKRNGVDAKQKRILNSKPE
jgi:SpoVK/Ycf46/Vps4 family AAA+-type ATPase